MVIQVVSHSDTVQWSINVWVILILQLGQLAGHHQLYSLMDFPVQHLDFIGGKK